MEKTKGKELIIKPTVSDSDLKHFLDAITRMNGINLLYIDPLLSPGQNFRTIHESTAADIIICQTHAILQKNRDLGKFLAYYKKVLSNSDIADIQTAESLGANYVIIDTVDWKIIPLENIIANLQNTNTKIITMAKKFW